MRSTLHARAGWMIGLAVGLANPAHAQVWQSMQDDGVPVFSDVAAYPGQAPLDLGEARGVPAARATRASAHARQALRPFIEASAARHAVPAALIEAVIAVESAYRIDAVSPKGAQGAMQLMPLTARELGVDAHVFDPNLNIDAGTRWLRRLIDRYAGDLPLALAAYNAGEAAVERYGMRVPPYPETRNYVTRVLALAQAHGLKSIEPVGTPRRFTATKHP